jgi:DNA-binding response OmpR family regulator
LSANILIVEDESIVAMEIESYLSSLDYNIVAICSDADDAYEKAISNDVDLILMDIYLIDSDGIDATIKIKEKHDIPIVFLTAHMDEETIERAIATNPIAYLSKPFNRRDLYAAIKIGLNQTHNQTPTLVGDIRLDDEFSFDSKSVELICCGKIISLSKKEKMLLILFINNRNILITSMIMECEIWADKQISDSTIRTLVSRLRSKLKYKFIETHFAEGYIFKKSL